MQRMLSWRPNKCALLAFSCVSASSSSFGFLLATPLEPSVTSCSASRPYSSSLTRRNYSSSSSMTATMKTNDYQDFTVAMFPCLSDNYGLLLHSKRTGETAAIDTPEAGPYHKALKEHGWKLTHILNTHHHHDHTGGNLELKKHHGATIYGPLEEKDKIPGIDETLSGGDQFTFAESPCQVINVGGHTMGHIAYYFPNEKIVFVGDSLFSLGCGRMFEGTPPQFWASLQRLRDLPDDTTVYCAHEYTESNGRFAMSVDANNADLQARVQEVKELRAKGEPTVPTLLGQEKKTNPFLRVDLSDDVRSSCGVTESDSHADAFAKVRKAKDKF
ncbi:hypothetical protein MPSEU_000709700 [Mayamaea pseudoterrestris]|nr:hypothetical protein MPSEU_000709700 [Mayamaea pseudoterrestris]